MLNQIDNTRQGRKTKTTRHKHTQHETSKNRPGSNATFAGAIDQINVDLVWSDGSVGSNSKKYAKTFLNTIFATFDDRGGGSDDLAQGQFVQLVSEKMIENALFEMEASKNFVFKKRG